MKLNHTFLHLDVSSSLTEYSQQKLAEISRFLLKDGHGRVHYSKMHHEFCVEIAINTRQRFFKSKGFHEDPYAAVDEAIEKLEKQFLKTHKAFKNHKRPDLSRRGRMKNLNGQLEYGRRLKKAA